MIFRWWLRMIRLPRGDGGEVMRQLHMGRHWHGMSKHGRRMMRRGKALGLTTEEVEQLMKGARENGLGSHCRSFRVKTDPPSPNNVPNSTGRPMPSATKVNDDVEYIVDPITNRKIPRAKEIAKEEHAPVAKKQAKVRNDPTPSPEQVHPKPVEQHAPILEYSQGETASSDHLDAKRTAEVYQQAQHKLEQSSAEPVKSIQVDADTKSAPKKAASPAVKAQSFNYTESPEAIQHDKLHTSEQENLLDSYEVSNGEAHRQRAESRNEPSGDETSSGMSSYAHKSKSADLQEKPSSGSVNTKSTTAANLNVDELFSSLDSQQKPKPGNTKKAVGHNIDKMESKVEERGINLDPTVVSSLDGELSTLKVEEKRRANEHFRAQRSYEYTVEQSRSKLPRSLETRNFFTSRKFEVPVTRPDVKKEYAILTPSLKIIFTRTIPFKGPPPQDLFSTLSSMAEPEKYVKAISKLENGGWKCIGGGGSGELIVFERNFSPSRRYTRQGVRMLAGFIGIISVAVAGMLYIA